jgi:hypothetical protein
VIKLSKTFGVLLAVSISVSASAATDLVINGSFTQPNVGSGWTQQASIPGWFSETGDLIEIGNAGVYGASCASAGCQLLEVNANSFGSVSQIVSGLTPGARYAFGWSMAGRNGGGPQHLDVSVDGVTVGQMTSSNFSGWLDSVKRFTASGTTAKLNFSSSDIGGAASYGNLVTNVSVGAVPEPASWAMMIAGFGLVGHAMRRRARPLQAMAAVL